MRRTQKGLRDPPKAAADDQLLLTKLYFSPARSDLVPRPRLTAKLAAGLAGPFTLVAAPAGYGKTTLLGAWQASPEGAAYRLGWLSLDGDDDDPIRFLQYLVAALDVAAPGTATEPARMLRAPQPPPVRTVIAALLNHLAGLQDDLVLVLDDYQVLENPAIHGAMAYLLEHRPPRLHLVILSRADPPLPLARLRARGQLAEIREADLRFTRPEAGQFLNEVMQLNLSEQDLAVVAEFTEGWVAGLQLAALSMQGRSDKASLLEAFAGNSRYIVGYLVEEVVARQSGEVQDFLLRTSALDRLCAPLCAALLDGRPASGPDGGRNAELSSATGILEYLERANLFVVPLDEAGYWYRYHHLFRDFLRARLQKLQPEDIPALHRRASQWYEAEGLIPEAVKHAFLSKDPAYAADVVERHGMWMLMHSGIRTVHEWCMSLPEDVMLARPVLCIDHAWTLVLAYRSDNWNAVELRLQQAENAAAALEDGEQARLLAGQAAVPRTFLRMAPNPAADPHEQLALAQQALDLLPADDPLRSTTCLTIGYAHMALQDPQAASDALEVTQRLALAGQNYYGAVDAIFHQARLAHCQGRLRRSMQICEQGWERFRTLFAQPEQELPVIGCLDIARGCVLLEQNGLEEAESALLHGLDLVGWGANPYDQTLACMALFRLREIQGRHVEALEFADRLDAVWPDIEFCSRALHVLHGLRTDPEHPRTLAAAGAWCESFSLPVDEHLPLPGIGPFGGAEAYYVAYLAWARAKIATGRPQATFSYLERQIGLAEAHGLDHRQIELSIVLALALHGLAENKRACEVLGRALAAAEPEGYVRTFDEGPALTPLLMETAARGISRRYIDRLLAVFGDGAVPEPALSTLGAARPPETATAPSRVPASPLVEPLTDRECEVLGLLAEGLSNVDIAQKLYIEVGTVKQHVNHLMGKLEATNRTQAVARARALGLLA